MPIEIKVPSVGESITEVTLVKWIKKNGEWVERDDILAELESEKATFEINAEESGILQIIAEEEATLTIGDVVCTIDNKAVRPANVNSGVDVALVDVTTAEPLPVHASKATPVAQAIISDKKVDTNVITPTGAGGKILKQDVLSVLNNPGRNPAVTAFSRNQHTEKMSNLRKTVSRRLVEAKNATAMLTTFNEVDMSAIMEIRSRFKDIFKEKHAVNLGFMSFFTKACCYALQEFPAVNAMVDGEKIIFNEYCDISIAVSAPKGLVVPVIRNAESLSMAEIERKIVELATKARENKLGMEEMSGGTFTITNGGVFGSLLSTPIINIPQSAILGMHKIQERPVAVNGQVVIKPMMYLALSYDHRIIDGRESVGFLVKVKELLENPSLLLFGKDPMKSLLEIN